MIYVGSLQNARLPDAMPRDLAATDLPVLWLGNNIERYERVAGEFGWRTTGLRADRPTTVTYKGMALSRDPADTTPVHAVTVEDENRTQVLAHTSGREPQSPWAVRTDAFTYVAEVPYAYLDSGGRYLAAADVLLGTLEPEAPTRHRALVRIEDVGPDTDVDDLRPIVELLVEEDVPFSVAVYPYFTDPRGVTADGEPQSARLVDEPELVDLLRYATEHGGTLVMHGYTHQYEKASNPRSAVSGDDYEFYRSTVDDDGHVALHGPVPADSAEWFRDRVATGLAEFRRVGLPTPTLWEFPHYGGSAVNYHETNGIFAGRYDRGSYYAGYCPGGRCGAAEDVSYDEVYGQHFPYPVRDVYGTNVVPENIGNLAPSKFNQYSARTVVDMLADAQRSLVVRDNVASFFYHPFLGTAGLRDLVSSLQSLGYTFASPDDILDDRTPR
ncbi:DUF2334 domain-containing protein [Saccharomonospora sp. CUA-673]|uniref:DUF2334 domain-containing protein n=1 Tax=Saccharomonospora sp. CUA-673 TaxID=1904969 RepID=UPI000AD687E6|nr:DUF2334 domain-containing protein [Saccharomonospora sp. CUA-673]